jgi:uncharacterized protein
VALGCTIDSKWRNRAEIFEGRGNIVAFLSRKWERELEYRLIKFTGNRIAVRFAYKYRDDSGNWFRAYGNENWEYDEFGLNRRRHAGINAGRLRRPSVNFIGTQRAAAGHHPGLSDLDL